MKQFMKWKESFMMNINDKWMQKYQKLKEYQEEHGNVDVPYSYEKDGIKLGVWVRSQRQAYQGIGAGKITEKQIELLNHLGIKWQVRDEIWNHYYQLLKEYQEEHGNVDVPQSYEKNGIKLGIWLNNQRQAYKGTSTCKITEEQIKLLNHLGIRWQLRDRTWDDYYQLLKEYQEKHGNIDVPRSYEKDGMKLGAWLSSQRHAYNGKGKIAEEKIELLNHLGMNWQIRDKIWNDYYQLLKEYQEEHGNIDVPYSYEKDGIKLGIWLNNQRKAYQKKGKNKIIEEQIQRLDQLGMKWQVEKRTWYDYYQLLKEYQEKHGTTNVSTYYQDEKPEEYRLGVWLHHQRQAYNGFQSLKITREQIQLLNELGIDWNILHTRFLNREITTENQEKYQQILLDRVNHIVDDLLLEGFSEMDATNQQEIEKVMIKRIWR